MNLNRFCRTVLSNGPTHWIPDKPYLLLQYYLVKGHRLNLKDPKLFTEKMQWLKLYDRKDIYSQMVDKQASKELFATMIGEKYIIPTIKVWDRLEDVNIASLPEKFVIKLTHDSGSVAVCTDKSTFDWATVSQKFARAMKKCYYWHSREWPYKNVKPRIIAEQFIDLDSDSAEYKFFCMNGHVQYVLVCTGKAHSAAGRTNDFFDREFNHLPLEGTFANSKVELQKPEQYEELIKLAETMSKEMLQVRADFYVTHGKIYVGEMTLFNDGGYTDFKPVSFDLEFGKKLQLPIK